MKALVFTMMIKPVRTNALIFSFLLMLLTSIPIGITLFLTHSFYREQQHLIDAQFKTTEKKQTPLLHIINGVLHEVEPNNRYELNIQALYTDIMRNSSRILCSEIKGVIFDKERKKMHFTAPEGVIAQDEKTLYFPRDFHGTCNEGTFQGNKITYHLDKQELSSTEAFKLDHPIMTFQAASGTVNLMNYEGTLEGEVSTVITLPGKQPRP